MNRFKTDRKIQKLADWIYVRECTSDIILEQRKEYSMKTRDAFEIYASQNNDTLKALTKLIETMVEADIKAQNEIFKLRARIDTLEKK